MIRYVIRLYRGLQSSYKVCYNVPNPNPKVRYELYPNPKVPYRYVNVLKKDEGFDANNLRFFKVPTVLFARPVFSAQSVLWYLGGVELP